MAALDDLAASFFGGRRAETNSVLMDGTTHTYVGTATSDSQDGHVMVELSGDVTNPDPVEIDGETYYADASTSVELPTSVAVQEGDEVLVSVYGGTPLKSPVVTANVGSGDRVAGMAQDAYDLADSVEGIAQQALDVANATGQHFWSDTDGAHVTEVTQEEWTDPTSTDYHSGPNSLWNSLGMLFRDGLNNLMALLAGQTATETFTVGTYETYQQYELSAAAQNILTVKAGSASIPPNADVGDYYYTVFAPAIILLSTWTAYDFDGQTLTVVYDDTDGIRRTESQTIGYEYCDLEHDIGSIVSVTAGSTVLPDGGSLTAPAYYFSAGSSYISLNSYAETQYAGQTLEVSYRKPSSLSFFDGLGNAAANIIASFSSIGATIGYADGPHTSITPTGIGLHVDGSDPRMSVGTSGINIDGPNGAVDINVSNAWGVPRIVSAAGVQMMNGYYQEMGNFYPQAGFLVGPYGSDAVTIAGDTLTLQDFNDVARTVTEATFTMEQVISAIPVTLFTGTYSETVSSTVTLSESAANFSRLRIEWEAGDGYRGSTELSDPDGALFMCEGMLSTSGTNPRTYITWKIYQVSGTRISNYQNGAGYQRGQINIGHNAYPQTNRNELIGITRVLGWR